MQNVGLLEGCVYPRREEPVRSKTEHLCKIRARTRSWPGQLCSELAFSADPFLGISCSPWKLLAGVPGMDAETLPASEVQVQRAMRAADSAESIDLSPIG